MRFLEQRSVNTASLTYPGIISTKITCISILYFTIKPDDFSAEMLSGNKLSRDWREPQFSLLLQLRLLLLLLLHLFCINAFSINLTSFIFLIFEVKHTFAALLPSSYIFELDTNCGQKKTSFS